jgi:glycosyltransferase involved in cell wall biosynthesis
MSLNILYYKEPKINLGTHVGGVFMVAHYLSNALTNEVSLTYYPSYNPRSYTKNLLKVYIGLGRRSFDIIHFITTPVLRDGGYPLLRFAKMTKAATLLNIHGIIPVEYLMDAPRNRTFRSMMYKNLANTIRSCKQADKIVTFSEFMRNQIVTWYGVRREKIAVIPNGVDLKRFSASTKRQKLDGDPAILYFGYLSNLKGIDLMIDAISRLRLELPNLKLHLVGHGNKTSFEMLAKKKHVENAVVFHGYVDPDLAPLYYRSADFCIFPSRFNYGITLLESMASGVPVIASNCGGTPEIISHGENGLLFEPGNVDELPKAILALSQDPNLRERISSNALKTIVNYSWENIAVKYLSLYNDLIK